MKIIIDPYRGGNDLGSKINNQYEKDILLNISEYMSSQFKKYNYDTFLTRNNDIQLSDNDRNNIIKNNVSKGDLIIQNRFSDNNEFNIIYPLRNNDSLPSYIDKNLEKLGFNVNKYFQRRLPSDTSLDYYSIIRENNPYNVLIIEFNDIDNYKEIVSDIVKSIVNYYDNTKYYIVKKGDSLYSIALSYNTTVDELKKINSLNSNNLSIGQKLIIPSIVEDNDSNNIEEDYFTYIVKSGDTLYGIAKKYNISVDVLKNLNKLSSNLLSVGQKIIIPNIVEDNDIDYGENYFTYIVKSGDTIFMGNNE